MADAAFLRLGAPFYIVAGGASFSNFALDQTTDQAEWIFQARDAITITRLGFRYGARTGTPPTYRISLQGVGSTGNPDGTIKGAGSPASKTFTPPADTSWNGLWKWQTLDNAYTCSRGEFLAAVVDYSAGTVDGSNNSTFTSVVGYETGQIAGFPYAIQNNAGTRARQGNMSVYGYGSAGTAYGNPMQAVNQLSHTLSTTPDEYALAFNLAAGYGSTYKVAGVRANLQMPAGGSLKAQLYSGTTILQTMTFDTDDLAITSQRPGELWFQDAALTALSFGTTYRIGFQPQDAAGNYFFQSVGLAAAADAAAYPGGTQLWSSSRTDAGAWTDDLTARPLVELILADMTAGGGGAALSRVFTGF
jgi:hypothetical protein